MTVHATIPRVANDALGLEALCKNAGINTTYARENKVIVRVNPVPGQTPNGSTIIASRAKSLSSKGA